MDDLDLSGRVADRRTAPPPVSVVTIQRGRLGHLRDLALALERDATAGGRLQQLVVANMGGPSPELVLPIDSVHLRCAVVRMGEPGPDGLPVAAARNAAIAAARHDVVLYLDVDVVALPGTVDAVARHAAEHPDAVVLVDVQYLPEGMAGDASLAERGAVARRHPAHAAPPSRGCAIERDHHLFRATGFAARREVLAAVGGFDEGHVGHGAEDTDLGQRLRAAGVQLHRVAGVVGHHRLAPEDDPTGPARASLHHRRAGRPTWRRRRRSRPRHPGTTRPTTGLPPTGQTMSDQTDVLKDLVETLEDGRKGFDQSAERMQDDNPATADTLRQFSRQRAQFAGELRELARERGVTIDEDGSLAAGLHRGWITLKDALTGDSPSAVLEAVETGEDHAMGEYEDALGSDDLDSEVRDVVHRQAEAIASAHREVQQMAARRD